jgi:Chaperone of endosialidase
MKTSIPAVLITLTLLCLGLLPKSQAVSPAPDGGYPGGNTAEGQNSLLSLTSGTYNTAVGLFSMLSDTDGNFNTGVGAGTLLANGANSNTATGAGGLLNNTLGNFNTANGAFALFSNTTGNNNTATGFQALLSNTTGLNNAANGYQALNSNDVGAGNTATGFQALRSNTAGDRNTAHGESALDGNTTGSTNTAIGFSALINNTTGHDNIAVGFAGGNVTTASNIICIGALGNNVDNSCFIGQIFGATSSGGTPVFVNSNGRLGTATSSKRFKDEVKPMDKASEAVFLLKPVTFHYKKEIDPASISQFGLVAEDVEKVNADLIVRDKEGKPYSVRYDQVNAMLLNEFLKEHSTVQDLKKEIATLTATVKEQAAQIQKVSDQLEASKPAPQVVNNP